MKSLIYPLILLCCCFTILSASESDSLIIQVRSELREAVDQWDGEAMTAARAKFERLLSIAEPDWLIHYYIALADDNLSQYYRSQQDMDTAEKMLDDAITHLEKSLEENKRFAEAYAMLAGCYGQKIAYSPMSAIYLGPRVGISMNQARRLEPDNPRVSLIDAVGYYFRPEMYGGDKQKAKELLKLATLQYETYQPETEAHPDWGHDQPYMWLGSLAMEQDSLALAEQYFQKCLAINPYQGFVKYQMMPRLQEAKQKENGSE